MGIDYGKQLSSLGMSMPRLPGKFRMPALNSLLQDFYHTQLPKNWPELHVEQTTKIDNHSEDKYIIQKQRSSGESSRLRSKKINERSLNVAVWVSYVSLYSVGILASAMSNFLKGCKPSISPRMIYVSW